MPSSAPVSNHSASRLAYDGTQANLRALQQLESAIVAHTDWLKKLHSGMAFSSAPSVLDTHPDAHLHCEIGHWLDCHHESSLRTHPALDEFKEEHRLLHQGAAAMLARFRLSGKPDISAFAALIGHTRRLHELLQQLRSGATLPHSVLNFPSDNASQSELITRLQRAQAAQLPGVPLATVCLLEIDQTDRTQQHRSGVALGSMMCEMLLNIKAHLRPEDWLLRKRDNALLLFLDQTSETQARSVLERIRDTLASSSVRQDNGAVVTFTVSVGATHLPQQGKTEQTIYQAEQALFAAKGMGGNRVVFAVDCQYLQA